MMAKAMQLQPHLLELHLHLKPGLAEGKKAYRSPRVFGDKFGEIFGDKFGDSLNFVINMVTILVTHFVRHQICHNFW